MDLADWAVEEAREDLSELIQILSLLAKRIAALRLFTSIASALASASLLALLVGEKSGQIVAAIITFVASLGGLFVTYTEDFSGGAGSTAKLREAMVTQVRLLSESEGQLRLGKATGDETAIVEALKRVNQVFGEIQAARAQLGLSV